MTRDPLSPEKQDVGTGPGTQQAATPVFAGRGAAHGMNNSLEDCLPWPISGTESDQLVALLGRGELHLMGLMPWSSNYTFLGEVSEAERTAQVIYKPLRGERPLWDFPRGTLAKRETAAYVVCRALGWHFVPPTVLRDGPHGRGSVQLFVDVDQDAHYFTFREEPAFRRPLQALCLFDIITNNADRKGGHCLRTHASSIENDCAGSIIAIDQGLCFHVEPKLRTVIWEFAGELLPSDLLADLQRLAATLEQPEDVTTQTLFALLSKGEVAAIARRTAALLAEGYFPLPPEDRRPYPWPLV